MENNSNRRILFAVGFVMFFSVIIIIWYFFYAKPIIAPTLNETNNPFPIKQLPPRFQFLNWGGEASTSTTEITDPLAIPLVRIWDKPATGQTFITQNILQEVTSTSTEGTTTIQVKRTVRATSTVVLFVDRTTGYIYGYPVETGKPYQISNTILPGIYDAYFFENGKKVIMRYIDQDKNRIVGVIGTLPTVKDNEMALPLTNIQYLSSQVTSIATNEKKEKISYIVATDNGSAIYTVGEKGPVLVTSSPFKEWILSYGGDSLYVTTKPSAYINGVTLAVPSFQPEITEKTGLMSNPTSGKVILHSMWGSQGLATFLSDASGIKILNTKTLASKCSWGERKFLVCAVPRILPRVVEGLPDDWYQGRASFNDDLYIIEQTTGEKYPLYTFKDEEGVFDITNISFSNANTYFSFNKKQDASLWMINTNLLGGDQ